MFGEAPFSQLSFSDSIVSDLWANVQETTDSWNTASSTTNNWKKQFGYQDWSVLNSAGSVYNVVSSAIDKDGIEYAVVDTILDSQGTTYQVSPSQSNIWSQ